MTTTIHLSFDIAPEHAAQVCSLIASLQRGIAPPPVAVPDVVASVTSLRALPDEPKAEKPKPIKTAKEKPAEELRKALPSEFAAETAAVVGAAHVSPTDARGPADILAELDETPETKLVRDEEVEVELATSPPQRAKVFLSFDGEKYKALSDDKMVSATNVERSVALATIKGMLLQRFLEAGKKPKAVDKPKVEKPKAIEKLQEKVKEAPAESLCSDCEKQLFKRPSRFLADFPKGYAAPKAVCRNTGCPMFDRWQGTEQPHELLLPHLRDAEGALPDALPAEKLADAEEENALAAEEAALMAADAINKKMIAEAEAAKKAKSAPKPVVEKPKAQKPAAPPDGERSSLWKHTLKTVEGNLKAPGKYAGQVLTSTIGLLRQKEGAVSANELIAMFADQLEPFGITAITEKQAG